MKHTASKILRLNPEIVTQQPLSHGLVYIKESKERIPGAGTTSLRLKRVSSHSNFHDDNRVYTLTPRYNMKTKFFFLLMAITFIISCDDDSTSPIPQQGDLFPLTVGNTWEYEQRSPTGYNDFGGIKKEITDVVQLEGREYYRMVTTWKSIPNPYIDTTYYRVDNDGLVYQRRTTGEEGNPFRLNATDKESWKYSASSTENDMHVTYQEPITISATEMKDTRLFSFDVSIIADEEWSTTLAPGIGIVTMYTSWTRPVDLKTAVISGCDLPFLIKSLSSS